jgi:hypothetical protein
MPAAVVAKKKMPTEFFCKFLNHNLNVLECIDGYVNANSLNIKHSPCYRCAFGIKVRSYFANE